MLKTIIHIAIVVFSLTGLNSQVKEPTSLQKSYILAQKLANKALKIEKYTNDKSLKQTYYRQAIKTLDSALTVRPNYQIALSNKFKYQYKLQDYNGLLKTVNRLFEIRPDLAVYMMHKAKIYELMGESKKAKNAYKIAIKTFENRIKTLNPLAISWIEQTEYAQTLYFMGRVDEGIKIYKRTKNKYKDEPYLKSNPELLTNYNKIMKYWSFNIDGNDYSKY